MIDEVATVDARGVRETAARMRAVRPSDSAEERSGALRRLARALREEKRVLALLLVREIGKMPDEAANEVEFAAKIVEHYAELLETRSSPGGSVRERPLQLSGVITPFNFPCSISVMKICAAYGAGAAVLWKPSPHAIGVAARLLPILIEHLGPVVAVTSTSDEESFGEMARAVDALSFTGGSGGAGILWRAAASKPIPMQLELGSCNSTIIGHGYPLEAAVQILRTSVFSYAGQKCSSTRRIIAPRELAPDLYDSLSAMVASERVGDPQEDQTTMPPLVAPSNAKRYQRDLEAWGTATTTWATAAKPEGTSACFVEPQIALAEGDAEPFRREIFGPAAVVIPYGSFDDGLRMANDTPFALFAGLLSGDPAEVAQFQANIRAGILKINQTTPGLSPNLPSQGWEASGVGPSELGADPFRPFLRLQTIYPFEIPATG